MNRDDVLLSDQSHNRAHDMAAALARALRAPLTWLHRLHCTAWAFRGGNGILRLATGEAAPTAHCDRCGDMRLLATCGPYPAGYVFWSPDRVLR